MPEATARAGTVAYLPSADAWVEEGGKVYLVGGRCRNCAKVTFPRRSLCDRCGSTGEQEPARLSSTGTLYSFSRVNVAPAGFQTPYVIGYVDLPEGVRVFGQVEHPGVELQVDDPVEVVLGVIRTDEDGRQVVSYRFRQLGEGAGA